MTSLVSAFQTKLGVSQKALLLGAGFVTKPTLDILANAGIEVTVGKSSPLPNLTFTLLTVSSLSNS